MEFYQQETIKIDGKEYISVKGTAKAYNSRHPQTIKDHINKHPDIFKNIIIEQKGLKKKSLDLLLPQLSSKQKMAPNRIWLQILAFVEVGKLLNDLPTTIPIKVICFLNKE